MIYSYDIEVKRAIASSLKPEDYPDCEFVEGWNDKDKMGVACLCVIPSGGYCPTVYDEHNLHTFQPVIRGDNLLVSFGGIGFDNKVLEHSDIVIPPEKCFDILAEWEQATGFRISLDKLAWENLQMRKSGNGALAPIRWQRGHRAEVINYCLRDSWLTLQLFELIVKRGFLRNACGRQIRFKDERLGKL